MTIRHALIATKLFSLLLLASVAAFWFASGDVGALAQTTTDNPVAATSPPAPRPPDTVELYRLRIMNVRDGAIQVSTDGGVNWRLLGRVVVPATTAVEGYLAADYARQGTVAATAVHGHRIRVSAPDASLHAPLVISIDPKEYVNQVLPDSYGGHRPGSSGIFTDIPAGTSLFRELAPVTGNVVLLQNDRGELVPLPDTFRPTGNGETLVIPVTVPTNGLVQVLFQNHSGGAVTATFADGTSRKITDVVQPVFGIGRFDGTSYTGVGRLNTAHTGVITVSTAPINGSQPEGEGAERRGGFQIEPVWHNARTEEAGAPMVMALGTYGQPRKRELEGMPPLFRDMVFLGEAGAIDTEARVDMSVDDGPWESLPTLTGARSDLFTAAGLTRYWKSIGSDRVARTGTTTFRLRLPLRDPAGVAVIARADADAYASRELARARSGAFEIVKGILTINSNPTNAPNIALVRLSIEGEARGFSNISPFALSWDTTRVPDGEYLIEADALSGSGEVVTATRKRVYVLNRRAKSASAVGANEPPR